MPFLMRKSRSTSVSSILRLESYLILHFWNKWINTTILLFIPELLIVIPFLWRPWTCIADMKTVSSCWVPYRCNWSKIYDRNCSLYSLEKLDEKGLQPKIVSCHIQHKNRNYHHRKDFQVLSTYSYSNSTTLRRKIWSFLKSTTKLEPSPLDVALKKNILRRAVFYISQSVFMKKVLDILHKATTVGLLSITLAG